LDSEEVGIRDEATRANGEGEDEVYNEVDKTGRGDKKCGGRGRMGI